MKLGNLAGSLGCLLLLLAAAANSRAQSPRVLEIEIDRVVHPLTSEVVSQGLAQAERESAAAVLIRLNTPGGLLTATQEIVQQIVASPVPVVTYVAPAGGRAASAGFMILIAGDVAAMAPGTNTGAAHPVLMGSEMDDIMKQKVGNDAAAAVRTVAINRGRNAELAEKAVLESKAFTEQEALENNLIDIVAHDVQTLFARLDGRQITRFNGDRQTLRLAGAVTYPFELSFRQRLLLPMTDPGLAFILMILGLVGIYIEFTHPGLILPGVAGAIAAILGLMSLSLLPINWAGAALIVVGLTCFVLEATITSGGILAVGGIIAMVLGAVFLIDTQVPELSIGLGVAIAATLPFALISVFLLRLAVQSFRYKVATGAESMIGEIGVARTAIGDEGRVFVHGEWWNAHSRLSVPSGAKVRVVAVDGLVLEVAPLDGSAEPPSQPASPPAES